MNQSALSIKDLHKTYASTGRVPEKHALKGIDLDIPVGSIFGLLGPNGAGKSTLINILAGLVRKTSGQVKIWGFDQDINPRQSRASIGVMPQELIVDPFLSPRASLEVQAGLYGVPREHRKTDELLEMVGLTDQAESYARQLSGGMKRRLLLAKALVHHPQILVLDEPTAGVDILLRDMLWQNVRKLNDQGMTIILTTHYLEEAEEMCDEIAIVNHGELIERAPTRDLLSRADRRTLVIDSGMTALPEGLMLPKDVSVEQREDGRFGFTYAPSRLPADNILDALRAAAVPIHDVTSESPDLEQVFLYLTRD